MSDTTKWNIASDKKIPDSCVLSGIDENGQKILLAHGGMNNGESCSYNVCGVCRKMTPSIFSQPVLCSFQKGRENECLKYKSWKDAHLKLRRRDTDIDVDYTERG